MCHHWVHVHAINCSKWTIKNYTFLQRPVSHREHIGRTLHSTRMEPSKCGLSETFGAQGAVYSLFLSRFWVHRFANSHNMLVRAITTWSAQTSTRSDANVSKQSRVGLFNALASKFKPNVDASDAFYSNKFLGVPNLNFFKLKFCI